MPLTIETDTPNTTEATNAAHYHLAMFMMVTGVPKITNERELADFITRVILLDLAGPTPLVEFVAWVKSFGAIHTNASPISKAGLNKQVWATATDRARAALRKATPSEPTPTGVSLLDNEALSKAQEDELHEVIDH